MSVWAAAELGDLDGVQAAFENGADIEERGGWLERTGLHYACDKGHIDIMKYLLDQQANVGAVDEGSRQRYTWQQKEVI